MSTENAPYFWQSALIWAVSSHGMMLKEPGTVLVMAPRFNAIGEVIAGPAESNLEADEITMHQQ